jgi:hypothetical protein
MKIYWNIAPNDRHAYVNDGDFYRFFQTNRGSSFDLNEELVEKWVKYLIENNLNFVTLNPIIPNFLDDDFAKANIYVMTKNGHKKLGEVKQALFKFGILGPGEVLCDTDWAELE